MRFLPEALLSCFRPQRPGPQSSKNTPSQEQDGSTQAEITRPMTRTLQSSHSNSEPPRLTHRVCYKCAHTPGFSTEAVYDQHVRNTHQNPSVVSTRVWMCKDTGCRDSDAVWTRFEGYKAHLKTAHKVTDTLRLWDDQMNVSTNIPVFGQAYRLRARAIDTIASTDFQLPSYQPASSRQDCGGSVHPPSYDLQNDADPPAYAS